MKGGGDADGDGSDCIAVDSTVQGTISTCSCFTLVYGYDNSTGQSAVDLLSALFTDITDHER